MQNQAKAKKLPRSVFLQIVENAPLVSIDLIIRNSKNEVLLGLRKNNPAKDTWFVPGGVIRKNETIARAFKRISRNELRIIFSVKDATFLGVFEHSYLENFAQQPGFGTHYIVLAYEVNRSKPLDMRKLPKTQHFKHRWWRLVDLLQTHDVHPNVKGFFL